MTETFVKFGAVRWFDATPPDITIACSLQLCINHMFGQQPTRAKRDEDYGAINRHSSHPVFYNPIDVFKPAFDTGRLVVFHPGQSITGQMRHPNRSGEIRLASAIGLL